MFLSGGFVDSLIEGYKPLEQFAKELEAFADSYKARELDEEGHYAVPVATNVGHEDLRNMATAIREYAKVHKDRTD